MRGFRQKIFANKVHLWLGAAGAALICPAIASGQVVPSPDAVTPAGAANSATLQQEAPAREEAAVTDNDIIVTGTLLRGAAPVGSNLIDVGRDRFQSQGATTTNELLATVPQVTNFFNSVPSTSLSTPNAVQVSRPNLRNLSPATASSSSTLVLIDGHRVAGVGVTQAVVDPDIVPPAAIERVEIVTDGGSATYGADAVAGVINFVTRKRFNGVQVDARYGGADDYRTLNINGIVGKDWGAGSVYAAYSYTHNDAIFGRDRSFIKDVDFSTAAQTPRGRQCVQPNVQLSRFNFQTFQFVTQNYAAQSLGTAGSFNACDASDDSSFVPRNERHSAMAGLTQKLNDHITLDLRAFYARRESTTYNTLLGSVAVPSTNPFYRPIPGNTTATQTLLFSFAPVTGVSSARTTSNFSEYGVNAELKSDLGKNFQLRTLFNYSDSDSQFSIPGVNSTLLAAAGSATTTATAINPYDIAATPNRSIIDNLLNSELAGQGRDQLLNLRAIVDGRLFTLPGGEVRIAAGYEYLHESFQQRNVSDAIRGTLDRTVFDRYSRSVNAVFGEVQVPIFGADNRLPGIYSLLLSGSVRRDDFSDFGATTNPKVGITYKPIEWITLRGSYGTSFNAPTPVDLLGSARNSFLIVPFATIVRPGETAPAGSITAALQGSRPDLQPQTATTYSAGFEIAPPFLQGLRATLNYYDVSFRGLLDRPPAQSPAIIAASFSDVVTYNPTAAQISAFAALAPNGAAVLNETRPFYNIVDFRLANYGNLKVTGLDGLLSYRRDTAFGGLDASVAGNYQLDRKRQRRSGAAITSDLAFDTPRLTLQGTLGADVGGFRAQATLNHTSGFDVAPVLSIPAQSHVSAFDTVNLSFQYAVPADGGVFKDLRLSLNINNVLDEDPPIYRLAGANGYANGFTLGRLIMAGVSKKF